MIMENKKQLDSVEDDNIEFRHCIEGFHVSNHQRKISMSMPSSPMESQLKTPKRVLFNNVNNFVHHPSLPRLKKDTRFDSFKTWDGKLQRQLTNLRGKPPLETCTPDDQQKAEMGSVPVHRYFDALEGPELDTLKATEEMVLPHDRTWPFLMRYPITSFGICLGVSSQAIMWKTLSTSDSTKFLHITPLINLVLWIISVVVFTIIFFIYLLKVIFYYEAVRREYYHPIRVNFFFTPWISLLFLALGLPPSFAQNLHESLWYILMIPFFCFELKLYGQWMLGSQRRLSEVANTFNHLSIVGNFVGALLGASPSMGGGGLKEGPIFFFAVGLAHYIVLFVTLYQNLSTNARLPNELHPVYFLFVAAPSVASMAWANIQGSFDYGSRIAYFIALFLYCSLAVRINFFRGFKFSLTWWAYTFPMTGAAIATIRYSNEVTNVVTRVLVVLLSVTSSITVMALVVTTVFRAFVMQDLFPNDVSIAISKVPKHHRHDSWLHLGLGSSDKEIESFLKVSSSESEDTDGSVKPLCTRIEMSVK